MKKLIFLCTLLLAFSFEACDLVDGTGVENPDLTLDQALSQPNSAERWVNGLKEQLATTYNEFIVTAELTTDNYVNNETFFNQNVDSGTLRDIDDDFDDAQHAIATLREQAEFGLETVLAADEGAAGGSLEAEMHFYKGVANVLAGELFTALPPDGDTVAVAPSEHFQTAVQDFQNAIDIEPTVGYYIGQARAYYNLGDKANARDLAQTAIDNNATNDYLRSVEFDGVDGPSNTLQDAVADRSSFDDLQPLPRLDFLDPKYGQAGDQESPIPMLKIEEAYLILAEAELSDNNLTDAQQQLDNLLDVVSNRPTRDFNELAEERVESDEVTQRPNEAAYEVRASADDPFRSGLVLDRTEATTVPTVSGTSVTSTMINGLSDTGADAVELLYLLRQEIFMGEGRRMVDLGIRWPTSENEALNNPNITDADRQPTVPSDLPPISEFDDFTPLPPDGSFQVTILHNLNAVLGARGTKFD